VEKSKYGKYERRRTPRHRKSRVLEGAFEDRNLWYKCWNCGHILKASRDFTGDPEKGGVDIQPIQIDAAPEFASDPLGNPFPAETLYTSVNVQGCPFCGTCNLP